MHDIPGCPKPKRYHRLLYDPCLSGAACGKERPTVARAGDTQGTRGLAYTTRLQKAVGNAIREVLIKNSKLKHRIHVGKGTRKSQKEYWQDEAENKTEERQQDCDILSHAIDIDRDPDLKQVLEMASEEDLKELYDCLHAVSVFSPVAKSMVLTDLQRSDLETADRIDIELHIESRFRFLAADARHLLHPIRRHDETHLARMAHGWPSYRDTLLDIRRQLQVPCSNTLDTVDLEVEIFLHLLSEHGDYVRHTAGRQKQGGQSPSHAAADRGTTNQEEDNQSDTKSYKQSSTSTLRQSKGGPWAQSSVFRLFQRSVVSPLSFGFRKSLLPTLAKTATTLALTKTQVNVIRNLGSIVMKRAAYHKALAFVHAGTSEIGKRMAIETAKQRLFGAVVQYTLWRQIFAFVGPMLWISTAWDLTKMSVGTDYARLTRTVFCMAQIRLLRTRGWH